MRWCNKHKTLRRDHWFTASPPNIERVLDAKRWCDEQASIKRYYYHYTNTRWWFEDENDAAMFTIMWSGK